MKPLQLFSFFHLNLMFSSIEKEARPEVIRRCYWPLLQLAAEEEIPLGIELTGYTLETIQAIDPTWVAQLRQLLATGRVELVGSGYAQLIGPLVPAAVNRHNQQLGVATYRRLLGVRPELALVNEQAWSAGLVRHYLDAGYRAVIMEWDNPAVGHPEWPTRWRYYPQRALGVAPDEAIPVLWNQSIAFQKFQRHAHGELELEDYLPYLHRQSGERPRVMALYGNDAEIFDYRPGRFHTEAALAVDGEWTRIRQLYRMLRQEGFRLVPPTAALALLDDPDAGQPLRLESAQQPIPVKKQSKYNITRWAVTGRDDLDLNSRCWTLCRRLQGQGDAAAAADWRELCYLWSSDFRTHITSKRWQALRRRLQRLERRLPVPPPTAPSPPPVRPAATVQRRGPLLTAELPWGRVQLNCRRGLALEAAQLAGEATPRIGTLAHGYYDHIGYGSDYYTGHLVLDIPGQHKLTDLEPVEPVWQQRDDGRLHLTGTVATRLGPLTKEWVLWPDRPRLELIYRFAWPRCPKGALHVGHVTLHPESFARDSLRYRTVNGGCAAETFPLDAPVDHLTPVSALISANQGLGLTDGWVELGDARHVVRVSVDAATAAPTGHILFHPVGDQYFCRLALSLQEMDDTACRVRERRCLADRECHLTFELA